MQIGKINNNEIEIKAKYEAQINSLQTQNDSINEELSSEKQNKFKIEQELEETKLKYQYAKA